MAWKPVPTTVEVETEIDAARLRTEVLLQVLVDRKIVSRREAEALLDREKSGGAKPFTLAAAGIDRESLDLARDEARRGRRGEALLQLERALGGDFVGRLAEAH